MLLPQIRSVILRSQKEQVDVALPWLLALRWGEVLCQIVLIGSVWLVMDIEIPLLPVSAIIIFEGGAISISIFSIDAMHRSPTR